MTTMTADRLDWRDNAACRTADAGLFFGPDNETDGARSRREKRAKVVCVACPVRLACLRYADDTRTAFGVFGGLGEDERNGQLRNRISRNRREVA